MEKVVIMELFQKFPVKLQTTIYRNPLPTYFPKNELTGKREPVLMGSLEFLGTLFGVCKV